MIKNAMLKAVLAVAAICTFCSCGERIGQPAYRVCAFVWPSCHDDSLAREYLWKEGIGEWEVIKRGNGIDKDFYLKEFDVWRSRLGIDSFVTYNMTGTDKDYLTYGRKGTEYWYRWSDYLDVPFFPTVSIGWDDTPRFPAKGEDAVKNVFGPCKRCSK